MIKKRFIFQYKNIDRRILVFFTSANHLIMNEQMSEPIKIKNVKRFVKKTFPEYNQFRFSRTSIE